MYLFVYCEFERFWKICSSFYLYFCFKGLVYCLASGFRESIRKLLNRKKKKKKQAFGYFLFVNCKLFTCAATEDMKIIAFPNVSTCSIYVGISYC